MFRKYPSIENTYRKKEMQKWLDRYPQLENETYAAQEKLHGSNLQIVANSEGNWVICSRGQKIGRGDNFQGVDVYSLVEEKYAEVLEFLLTTAQELEKEVRLYGELCGPKIQKGVDYGPEVKIYFFDMMIGEEFLPLAQFYGLLCHKGFDKFLAPIMFVGNTLREVLEKDICKISKVYHKPDNICEGVVIKPWYRVYQSSQGSLFYWKSKNEKFKEKQREKKPQPVNGDVERLNQEFRSYVTDQRLQNIFSKYGEIEEPKQIGTYIKYMLDDAKEDFLKDFGTQVSDFGKKEEKKIYNVGSKVANMLQSYL